MRRTDGSLDEAVITYWSCVVRNPLEPNYELVTIQTPAAELDHVKRVVLTAKALRHM